MRIYRVGGAVRDRLLGLTPQETDWVVTGASVDDMLARGFRRLDPEIPVFAHPETGDEYALARRERKQAHGHKGFIFEYGPDISLEEDLVRRDLTVNAMAEDDGGQLIDPHGGREDLGQRRLRHVSPAFVEDPLRVLRLARFAAQLADFEFAVVAETADLARRMSQDEDLLSLTPARRWRELARALACAQPAAYLIHLDAFGALTRLMPWLAPEDVPPARVASPAKALATASRDSGDPGVRLAAACVAASRAGATGRPPDEWPVPREIRDLARLCVNHPLPDTMTPDAILTWLEAVDAWRRGERLQRAVVALRAALPEEDVRLAHLVAAADLARGVRPAGDASDPRLAVRRARLDIIAGMSVPVGDGP